MTSPLVPWNTCGAYMSGVLGVPTASYLPFCFFNLLSPILDVLYGYLGFKVATIPPAPDGAEPELAPGGSRPADVTTRRHQMTEATPPAEPRRSVGSRFPSAYTILFVLIVLAAIATWIVPAGTYDLNDAGEPVPGTYHEVDAKPSKDRRRLAHGADQRPVRDRERRENIDYYNEGTLFGAIDIALFIIVIGGFLGVTMKSGAIQAGIGSLVERMRGRERWMIPVLMCVFALGGTSCGMAEESLAFYALVITVMIAAGYDALVGAAVVLLGCGIGVLGSTVNPFATRIASGIAGVPLSDGLLGRLVILIAEAGDRHRLRPALRRSREAGSVEVRGLRHEGRERGALRGDSEAGAVVLTVTHKAILAVFVLAFVVMIYGVIPWEDMGIPCPPGGGGFRR